MPVTNQGAAAREKAEAARAAQARAEQRRRVLTALTAVVAVVAVVGGLVIAKLTAGGSKPAATAAGSKLAAPAVVKAVTGVPVRVFDTVGGSVKVLPKPVPGSAPLTADGKPRVLCLGAEYCPYCAAERWAVVASLARVGTWSNLGQTTSGAEDVYPNTATLSFHGARYTSNLISFTGVEGADQPAAGNSYTPLDTAAPADLALLKQNGGGFPFVDIAGRHVISGASYDVQLLAGKTHAQIAARLTDPSNPIAKAVTGTANVITAAVCQATGGKPAAVCTSRGVTVAAQALASQGG